METFALLEYISFQNLPNQSASLKIFRETEASDGPDLVTSHQNLMKF